MDTFDVIVLGAGSAGLTLARAASAAGRSVAVVEGNRVGGDCPFVACMPSKALLRSAEVRHLVTRAVELGAVADIALDDGGPALARAVLRRDRTVNHGDDRAKAHQLEELEGACLVRGRGRIEPGLVVLDGRRLRWTDLVVATGSAPSTLPIDGLDRIPTWTSEQALTSGPQPSSLAVIGGGAIGCELAQVYARFGVEVTLIESQAQLLSGEDRSVADLLASVLTGDGVDVRLGCGVVAASSGSRGARLDLDDGHVVDVERVLVAVGRTPNTAGIGLESLGLEVEGKELPIDERCRVRGLDHVWAAGDVTAVVPYTHGANYQAKVVAANLFGKGMVADYRAIPRAVYTDPPVASVGVGHDVAGGRGIDVICSSVDLAETPRAGSDGSSSGRLVLTADRTRRVLVGAAAMGPGADELIGQATLAIHADVPLSVLAGMVHPFPTYAEAYGPAMDQLLEQIDGFASTPSGPAGVAPDA